MRDHLTHRYFDTQREIVQDVITHDIEPLQLAVAALLAESAGHDDSQTALDLDGDAS